MITLFWLGFLHSCLIKILSRSTLTWLCWLKFGSSNLNRRITRFGRYYQTQKEKRIRKGNENSKNDRNLTRRERAQEVAEDSNNWARDRDRGDCCRNNQLSPVDIGGRAKLVLPRLLRLWGLKTGPRTSIWTNPGGGNSQGHSSSPPREWLQL